MVFKSFGTLLLLLMVSASLAENLNKTVALPETKQSDKNEHKPSCETNEVFLECNNKDATICQDSCNSNSFTCTETVCQRGCFCKKGYARVNAASATDRIAKCIPKKCCPPNIGDINLEICSEHCQKYLYGVPGLLCPK